MADLLASWAETVWNQRCPRCGGNALTYHLYGMVGPPDADLNELLDAKRVVLEGCTVGPDSVTWTCTECDHAWD
jgi:hypothetical protein